VCVCVCVCVGKYIDEGLCVGIHIDESRESLQRLHPSQTRSNRSWKGREAERRVVRAERSEARAALCHALGGKQMRMKVSRFKESVA